MLGLILMVGYPLILRRIFWFVRLTVLVALLLPGSIPTMLLLLTKYTLDIVDSEGIIITFVGSLIMSIFEVLPPMVQTLIIPILALVIVVAYLVAIKLLNPKEPLISTIRRQRDIAYNKFVKIPTELVDDQD